LLWTVSSTSDTYATQCFRYNVFTNTWTKFPITKRCGVVNFSDDRLYLGANDTNYIEVERKDFTRSDYADREYTLNISSGAVNDLDLTVSSTTNTAVGDVLVQTHYVTLAEFNALLSRLDNDPSITDSDYSSSIALVKGGDLTNAMTSLIAKLNADASTVESYSFSGTTDFATIQTEYNTMITTLNSDSGVFYTDYSSSSGTSPKEASIQAVDVATNTVTLNIMPNLLVGDVILYKGISAKATYNPNFFDDPENEKQVFDGKTYFTSDTFTNMSISYASDLSPSFEKIDFSGAGIGDWGLFAWGNQTWGGGGTSVPIRTLIPLEKQRCRFIRTRIEHVNARESFQILGTANNSRPYNTKAYR
jgi:hypothetical protein